MVIGQVHSNVQGHTHEHYSITDQAWLLIVDWMTIYVLTHVHLFLILDS